MAKETLGFYRYPVNDDKAAGEKVRYAYLDGYLFGETLLEGVVFKYHVDDRGKLRAEVLPEHLSYFRTLNQDKWLKAAVQFLERSDDQELQVAPDDSDAGPDKARYVVYLERRGGETPMMVQSRNAALAKSVKMERFGNAKPKLVRVGTASQRIQSKARRSPRGR